MKSILLRRKGHAVRGFDPGRAAGFEVKEGETVAVSEFAALELRRDDPDGWELVLAEAQPEVEPEPGSEVKHADH